MYRSLNIGCGQSTQCTNRIDITRDSKATELANATQLPYKNESFDYIIAESVLEHQANPLQFLEECHRVLKHIGKLELVTDNAGYLGWFPFFNKFKDIHGTYSNHRTSKDKHYMIFTEEHIRNLLRKAGFAPFIVSLGTRWKPALIQKFWIKIIPTIGHSHIYVKAWRYY